MKMKKYITNNLSEGMQQVRHELGENALVLSTKPIKIGGFLGVFKKRRFEIVAVSDMAMHKKSEEPKEEDMLLTKLSEMEVMMKKVLDGSQTKESDSSRLKKWVDQLRDQEVDQEVINFIVKKITKKYPDIEQKQDSDIQSIFFEVIVSLLEEGIQSEEDEKKNSKNEREVVTLLGPTGVGKTTTIAKLASREVLFRRRKVGLVTTDTFRVGAVEQLKTYANILNLPLEVVESSDKVEQSLEKMNHCSLIFMDSAGRNYLDQQYIDEINRYLSTPLKQKNYLVLSMTSRWADVKKIVNQMKEVQVDRLILTKWDEATCFGVALNLLYCFPYPLSFNAIGQGVPEDIIKADAVFMAKKILGVDDDNE